MKREGCAIYGLMSTASVIYRNVIVSLIGMQASISSASPDMKRGFHPKSKTSIQNNTFTVSPNSLFTFWGRLSMGHLAKGRSE